MMSMRTRKLSEVLAFLIALGAAYALWFVPMSLLKQLLVLAFGLAFSGWAAVGRPKTQSSFLTRALMFHKLSFRRLSLILFLIIAFGLDIAWGFIDPNYQEWIIVNDNFPAYLATEMLLKSVFFLMYLFAPEQLTLLERAPAEE